MPGADDANAQRILKSLPRIVAASDALARAFAEGRGGGEDLLGAGHLLGAAAAASWARSLTGQKIVGRAFIERVRLRQSGRPGAESETIEDDDPTPSSAIVRALIAARAGLRPRLLLGPRAEAYAQPIGAALGDLLDGPIEAKAETATGDRAPSAVVFAPYYWDKRDLDRLVRHLIVEVLAPAPRTSNVHVLVARGWEQRNVVLDKAREKLVSQKADLQVEELDAERAADALRLATDRIAALGARSAALFVHPMWRERSEIEREIATLAALPDLDALAVGHRSSMPWVFGTGAFGQKARLDFTTAVPAIEGASAAKRRATFAAQPNAVGAARVAIASRL